MSQDMIPRERAKFEATNPTVALQRVAFERKFGDADLDRWAFHDTDDPLTRYLRDRRLQLGIDRLLEATNGEALRWNTLVVCGGVGGEGTYLANRGFRSVTVGDFSESALDLCRRRDPRLARCKLNAENLPFDEGAFDLVLVQDGLHHLSRPTLGFTEMLRVGKRAAIVIEPHLGLVARIFGSVWEREGDAINYVFRWNRSLVEQALRSYLLETECDIGVIRLWDHNVMMRKLTSLLPGNRGRLRTAKLSYGLLDTIAGRCGNMMIAVIVKGSRRSSAKASPSVVEPVV